MKTTTIILAATLFASCGYDPDGFRLDASVPEHLVPAITAGMDRVNLDAGSRFRFDPMGDSEIRVSKISKRGTLETISFNGRVQQHMITFSDEFLMAEADLSNYIAPHEFGHAAGLVHVCNPPSYMHDQHLC